MRHITRVRKDIERRRLAHFDPGDEELVVKGGAQNVEPDRHIRAGPPNLATAATLPLE
jgi:hypothetical protein